MNERPTVRERVWTSQRPSLKCPFCQNWLAVSSPAEARQHLEACNASV
jgi:hypothetical protein